MNQLYPIIRRARRSLWPDKEPVALPPVEVAEPVEEEVPPAPVALVTVETVPVEPTPVAETPSFALATEAAPVEPKPKKGKRRGNAAE